MNDWTAYCRWAFGATRKGMTDVACRHCPACRSVGLKP